ncbi:hypothetical protein [Chitinophaga sp.]|uniref:hypothetical protein n=1 Tax=Chitinophaga sp. TaxID=1869181 RepID=UPI0031E24FC3
MIKKYNNFNEIADEIRSNTPPTVYKYRTWENDNHKRIIIDKEVWFAHPHSLNDPYDVRPPYNFVIGAIDWNTARTKIREAGRVFEPDLTAQELEEQVDIRIEAMRADPVAYFQQNRGEYILEREHYDPIGVLSCCKSAENEAMWAYYGNHFGFAVGFNTVELARALHCTVGDIKYDDTPVDYHVLGNNEGILDNELFQKSTRWQTEEELRFITAGIGLIRPRAANFPIEAVSEIVFGLNTSQQAQDEMVAAAAISLPGVPIYRVRTRANAYGLEKVRL